MRTRSKSAKKVDRMEKKYQNLGYFFLLLIPLVFLGFYKTYIIQFPSFKNIPQNYIHVHAFVATLWVSLFIAQPFLILNHKYRWHRRVGHISYVLFPVLLLSFIPSVMHNLNSENPERAFFGLADGSLLLVLYGLGIYYRQETPLHMRYMIAATTVLLDPTIGRILSNLLGFSGLATQNVQFLIIQSVLLTLLFFDRRHKKPYEPYIVAMIGWCIHQLCFYSVFL